MNILAINTCFTKTYVSIKSKNDQVYKTIHSKLKQSENVLQIVDEALKTTNQTIKDLDVIACVIGPGSFTGIRIGASLSKGFCAPFNQIKKISINSLDLLAFSYIKKAKSDFWVILNALSGNLFAKKFDKNGKPLTESLLLGQKELDKLSGIVVGLKEENLDICNDFEDFSSEELLKFAENKFLNNEFCEDFLPLYLRKSQAEDELDKKNGNK